MFVGNMLTIITGYYWQILNQERKKVKFLLFALWLLLNSWQKWVEFFQSQEFRFQCSPF